MIDPRPSPAPAPAPPRVVLVDDDSVSLEILQAILLQDGAEVRAFRDPAEALRSMVEDPPDVLVADWFMPGMDGPDLLKKVRATPALAGTYCLLVTAHDVRGRKVTGLLVGADDYLIKPVSESELLVRIRVGMRVRRLERQAVLAATAAALGHEINNPLTAVLGYVDMARAHVAAGDREKAAAALDRMEEGAVRIRDVVARFLSLQDPRLKQVLPGSFMFDLAPPAPPPPPGGAPGA